MTKRRPCVDELSCHRGFFPPGRMQIVPANSEGCHRSRRAGIYGFVGPALPAGDVSSGARSCMTASVRRRSRFSPYGSTDVLRGRRRRELERQRDHRQWGRSSAFYAALPMPPSARLPKTHLPIMARTGRIFQKDRQGPRTPRSFDRWPIEARAIDNFCSTVLDSGEDPSLVRNRVEDPSRRNMEAAYAVLGGLRMQGETCGPCRA